MTREPQVGDVYDYCWCSERYWFALVVVRYVEKQTHWNTNKTYYTVKMQGIKSKWIREEGSVGTGHPTNLQLGEYKGKLAPRYKRLFGTYFIPDKPND